MISSPQIPEHTSALAAPRPEPPWHGAPTDETPPRLLTLVGGGWFFLSTDHGLSTFQAAADRNVRGYLGHLVPLSNIDDAEGQLLHRLIQVRSHAVTATWVTHMQG